MKTQQVRDPVCKFVVSYILSKLAMCLSIIDMTWMCTSQDVKGAARRARQAAVQRLAS